MVNARGSLGKLYLFYPQVPNKREVKINGGWEISENFIKMFVERGANNNNVLCSRLVRTKFHFLFGLLSLFK